MSGNIDMATNRILNLPAPLADEEPLRKVDGGGGTGHKIEDADQDTGIYTEQAPDEDKIHIKTKGVECGLFSDDGILTLAKQSRSRAFLAGAQAIPHATFTKVVLDGEDYDNQNEFDIAVNSRFTAKEAGYYMITGFPRYANPTADKYCFVYIYKNAAQVSGGGFHSSWTGDLTAPDTDVLYLAANDFIELWTYHNCGGNESLRNGSDRTFFAVHKLS